MDSTTSANNTAPATGGNGGSSLALKVALPVCLIGIPLIVILVIVAIYYYKSRSNPNFKLKNFFRRGGTFNVNQNEAAELENVAIANHKGDASTYANLSETVRESKTTAAPDKNNSKTSIKNLWTKVKGTKKNRLTNAENSQVQLDSHDVKVNADSDSELEENDEVIEMTSIKTKKEEIDAIKNVDSLNLSGRTDNKIENGGISIAKQINGEMAMRRVQKQVSEPMDGKTAGGKSNPADNRKTFVVMYPLDAVEPNLLSLSVNDVIFFMDEEQDGWLKGEKKMSGEVGWFPKTHVREGMTPLGKKPSTATSDGRTPNETTTPSVSEKMTKPTSAVANEIITTLKVEQDNEAYDDFDDDNDDDDDYETGIEYRAVYPYRALEEGDLDFDAGDVIVVVEKQENGWWRGYRGDDHGFFPGSYVQVSGDEGMVRSMNDLALADNGDLSSPTEDMSRSVIELMSDSGGGGGRHIYDDDDVIALKNKKKKKDNKARASLGLFLKSIPRKMASNRTGEVNDSPSVSKSNKTKKMMPAVVQKKRKPSLTPMTRRNSVAPSPPSHFTSNRGGASNAMAKNVMSDLAQKVAETAQHRQESSTIYDEIGMELLNRSHEGSEVNTASGNQAETGKKEQKQVRVTVGATKEDLTQEYSNLDSIANQNKIRTKKIQLGLEKSNEFSKESDLSTALRLTQSSKKPLPPRKPNFSGSTPNIAAALANECKTVDFERSKIDVTKPVPPLKPPKSKREEVQSVILKPKPLKEKPRYLSPGFPDELKRPGRHGMQRNIYRSLDNIAITSNEEELEANESDADLGIMKWLHRKLSAEDEIETKEQGGKPRPRSWNRTIDVTNVDMKSNSNSNLSAEDDVIKPNDSDRMKIKLETILKASLNEESFA